MRSWLSRLSTKLALLLVATFLVGFGVLTLVESRQQRRASLDSAVSSVTRLADALRAVLHTTMRDKRWADLEDDLRTLTRDADVLGIEVLGRSGRLRVGAGVMSGRMPRQDEPPCLPCHRSRPPRARLSVAERTWVDERARVLEVASPIRSEARCRGAACHAEHDRVLGVIVVRQSLADMDTAHARARLQFLLVGLGCILFVAGVGWVIIARWVRRPVRALSAATRRVAAGDLTSPVARPPGELGAIAESLTELAVKLKSSQDQLVRTAQLVAAGKLAAGVAHELNNPLTGVLAYAEELLADTPESDPRRQDLQVIVRETLRCRGIVRNLLDFARQTGPELAQANLASVIRDTITLLHKHAAFRDVVIAHEIPKTPPPVRGDPHQLQQVLVNLLVNAAEAMPDGGRIHVGLAVDAANEQAVLSVSDTGTGIPEAIRDRIFEPFFSTKGGKTDGFGLAVSWSIVQQHGGVIDVESEIGRGTTFRVRLPLGPAPTAPKGAPG
jgi:two-component system NtrC family sensor kinase